MWFYRDIETTFTQTNALPIKVLKGPRQVGKTSLLERLPGYQTIYFDDAATRRLAQENPRMFFDQLPQKRLILDEASLAPEIFPELKRRVDEHRRKKSGLPDFWITGSNQTLLQKNVRESLAGRASYFDLNTLSIHELGPARGTLPTMMMKGGWPELHIDTAVEPKRYLNDLISTFIERDIVAGAGIEKKAAFSKTIQLLAGRVGQLFNASDIAKNVGVDVTTVQSWVLLLAENGILRSIQPYTSNLNQRLIKAPKWYFEDVGIAVRMQGWADYHPLLVSPAMGHLVENLAVSEVSRFFINRGERPDISYVRSKEKVEIDLLIRLPNQRYVAAEVKTTPQDFSVEQLKLLDSLKINLVEKWILTPDTSKPRFKNSQVIRFAEVWETLSRVWAY